MITAFRNTALSRAGADSRIAALLGGPVAPATLNLLWAATNGDNALIDALVLAGRGVGELAYHGGLWRWGGAPRSLTAVLIRLIESGTTSFVDGQLAALEHLTQPLTKPYATVTRARRDRRGGQNNVNAQAAPRLTSREHDVLALLAEGLTARAMARRLGLSPRTVSKHQENLYRKLGTSNRVNTVLVAQRLGMCATTH